MNRILAVDDEPDILELVRYTLAQEGFDVQTATNGAEAISQIALGRLDLVVLDLMLPDQSGIEICRKIRKNQDWAHLPIIMLTARSEDLDRIVGFEVGADDYLTKPFNPRELVLRVKAIMRRSLKGHPVPQRLTHGPLSLDLQSHRCTVHEQEVELTVKEFGILAALMSRPGRVLTRQQLLDEIWGEDISVTHRTVDSHLKKIREKLGPVGQLILTVRGFGYRFAD